MGGQKKFTDYKEVPLVLGIGDLQQIMGISRSTAYALANRADFPSFRSGNRIKISKEALFEWMRQQSDQKRIK